MLWVNTNRILHRQSVQSTNIQSGVVRFVSTDCKARKIIALKSDNQKQMENAHPCHRLAGKSQEEQSSERDPSSEAVSPKMGSRRSRARLHPFVTQVNCLHLCSVADSVLCLSWSEVQAMIQQFPYTAIWGSYKTTGFYSRLKRLGLPHCTLGGKWGSWVPFVGFLKTNSLVHRSQETGHAYTKNKTKKPAWPRKHSA